MPNPNRDKSLIGRRIKYPDYKGRIKGRLKYWGTITAVDGDSYCVHRHNNPDGYRDWQQKIADVHEWITTGELVL